MAKRSFIRRVSDGACLAAAFVMVLYVTFGDHRLDGPGRGTASAYKGVNPGTRPFEGDRIASAAVGTPGR